MSYLVLARKFRPQTFVSILGQEHITKAIANAIVCGRVPHAFLFTGPRGVGKTTMARVLARALNCTGRELPAVSADADSRNLVEPCGECANCKEIAKSCSLAVWEIDGASNNSVDNVRDLIDSLRSVPPPGSRYKIYIVDEVHMLSTAAFNALLKSLEEPPPNTIFIFATTEPHKIPDTVTSRCQRHDFRRVAVEVIIENLKDIIKQEKIEADEEVLEFIALKAQGGLRDAQSMLDRLITFSSVKKLELVQAEKLFGVVDSNFFFRLTEAVFKQDAGSCFQVLDEAFSQSLDIRQFAADFLNHWRAILLISLSSASGRTVPESALRRILEISKNDFERLKSLLSNAQPFDMQRLFDLAEVTASKSLGTSFSRYVFEAGIAKMASLASLRPLPEILQALSNGQSEDSASPASKKVPSRAQAQVSPDYEASPELTATNDLADSAVAAAGTDSFNPSWQDFISFVKSVRSEHVLAAFLRRVFPQTFVVGSLVIEASEFDSRSLREAETLATLKSCLENYSGVGNWDVRFIDSERVADEPQAVVAKRNIASPQAGSLAVAEKTAEIERIAKIDSEARRDPLVQAALSMFEGSAIERVNVLKER